MQTYLLASCCLATLGFLLAWACAGGEPNLEEMPCMDDRYANSAAMPGPLQTVVVQKGLATVMEKRACLE